MSHLSGSFSPRSILVGSPTVKAATSPKGVSYACRYIPSRRSLNVINFTVNSVNQENASPMYTANNVASQASSSNIPGSPAQQAAQSAGGPGILTPSKEEYRARLAESLLYSCQKKRIFSFAGGSPTDGPHEGVQSTVRTLYTPEDERTHKARHRCHASLLPAISVDQSPDNVSLASCVFAQKVKIRFVPKSPERVLDAPYVPAHSFRDRLCTRLDCSRVRLDPSR
jgi:hypothetical protein